MKHLTKDDLILIESYLNQSIVYFLNQTNNITDPHIKIITSLQNKIIDEIHTMKTDKRRIPE